MMTRLCIGIFLVASLAGCGGDSESGSPDNGMLYGMDRIGEGGSTSGNGSSQWSDTTGSESTLPSEESNIPPSPDVDSWEGDAWEGTENDGVDPDEPLPPCLAEGLGFITLSSSTGSTLIQYAESVEVEATHLEPGGCLTSVMLTWTRAAGCGLTVAFSPGSDGVWQLEEVSLLPGPECG